MNGWLNGTWLNWDNEYMNYRWTNDNEKWLDEWMNNEEVGIVNRCSSIKLMKSGNGKQMDG